jgi:hypothetical protein
MYFRFADIAYHDRELNMHAEQSVPTNYFWEVSPQLISQIY